MPAGNPLGYLVNPQQPAETTEATPPGFFPGGPPQSPEELAARVSGWDKFFEFLVSPGVSQSLLTAGATMLQPRKPGESQLGKVVQGAAVGASTLSKTREGLRTEARESERINLDRRRVQALEKQTDTAATESEGRRLLTREEIAKMEHENSPAQRDIRRRQAEADIARLLASARAADASVVQAKQPAAQIQVMDQVAKNLILSGAFTPEQEAEAQLEAFRRINLGSPKTPEELRLQYMMTITSLAADKFRLAGIDPAARQEADTWVAQQLASMDSYVNQFAARTNQVTTKTPPSPSEVQTGVTGVLGGQTGAPTPTPAGGAQPTAKNYADYWTAVNQYPTMKAQIDAQWKAQYGTNPPGM